MSFNLVSYYLGTSGNVTRKKLFQEIYRSTLINRNSTRVKEIKGYSLQFDGLYQGTYIDHLDVIGAQRGGGLST